MSYSIVESAVNPPTQNQITAFYSATNDRAFNIRISIANTTTGTTLLGSTVLTPNQFIDGTVSEAGLNPGTNYSVVMTIRRASNFEFLGDRSVIGGITTASAPVVTPAAPSWSSNFPAGTTGSSYSGSATVTIPGGGSWGFITAPSIPGLSLSYSGLFQFSLSGTPTSAGTYNFSARATDDFDQVTDASFSIVISDPAPPPRVPTPPVWTDNVIVNTFVVGTAYSDSVSANNSPTYSISPGTALPAGISLNSSTGAITGTPTTEQFYSFTITAANGDGNVTVSYSGTVTSPPRTPTPPAWTDDVIVNTFIVGTAYSDSVSATNSPTYSISSGTLPAGISLNSSTGAITGTPTTAQIYSFTIRAANGDGAVTVTYNGTTSSPPVFTDQTLAPFLQGRVYSDAVVATQSPTYSVITGSLPTGISLNASTGAVTGTPTGSGAFSFTIRALNVSGNATASFSGNIVLVPNWTDNTIGNVINGVEFSDGVVATNSPSYAVTAGTLPAGLALNTSTGAITGTPTGTVSTAFSFTITATNANGSIAQAFSGNVQPDLTGQISLFNGTVWAPKEVYVFDGTDWVRGQTHVFNGTAWVKSSF